MPLINCEINFILTWSTYCVISFAAGETKFEITDTKLYVPMQLYKLKIMQNCLNNQNLILKEQLAGININQKFEQKEKTNI